MAVIFSGEGTMKGRTFKDTGILLQQVVHPNIENKLFLKDKSIIDKEVAEAAELQSLFQEIKNYTTKKSHILSNEFAQTILDNMPKDVRQLFDYAQIDSNALAGDLFEQDIAKIIGSVFSTIEGAQSADYSQILVGQKGAKPGKIDITFTYPKLVEIFGQKNVKKVLRSLVEKVGKDTNGDQLYQLRAKQGKIDILSPTASKATVEFEGNEKLKRFYQLLSGSSFTAKNYVIKNSNSNMRIKLGNTNQYKVYMGTLAFSNPELNQDEKEKIFFASQHTKSAIARLHKKHIRFVYELIGPGLYYDGVSLGKCKFLIVNEKNGENIYVLSTKELIYNLFTEQDILSGRGRVTHLYLDTSE